MLAELDYLLGKHVGSRAQEALLREVERGAYQLEPFDSTDVAKARAIAGQYRDLSIGLAHASIVVLAGRYGITEVLTLDECHFRTISGPADQPFQLLPADRPHGTKGR